MREVVLSGFQLELYTGEERAFSYWYAAQIVESHLECLDEMVAAVPKREHCSCHRCVPVSPPTTESAAHSELQFQFGFLTALQLMSIAMFSVRVAHLPASLDWGRMRPNLVRRCKWALRAEYGDIPTPAVGHPEFPRFLRACAEAPTPPPGDWMRMASDVLGHVRGGQDRTAVRHSGG